MNSKIELIEKGGRAEKREKFMEAACGYYQLIKKVDPIEGKTWFDKFKERCIKKRKDINIEDIPPSWLGPEPPYVPKVNGGGF